MHLKQCSPWAACQLKGGVGTRTPMQCPGVTILMEVEPAEGTAGLCNNQMPGLLQLEIN